MVDNIPSPSTYPERPSNTGRAYLRRAIVKRLMRFASPRMVGDVGTNRRGEGMGWMNGWPSRSEAVLTVGDMIRMLS